MPQPTHIAQLLARTELFRALSQADLLAIAAEMREATFEPDQTIFSRGDPGHDIHLVLQGRVRLSVLSMEGRVLSFNHASVGQIFGEIAALDGGSRTADATAMASVRTMALSRSALMNLVDTRPVVARAAIQFLCNRVRATSAQAEDIALHSIMVRIARFLLSALHLSRAPQTGATPVTLDLGMSQADLADLLGASRQKTNLAISNLQQSGALARSKGVYACNVSELRRIARAE